ELFCALGEKCDVIDETSPIHARHAEEHLRLMVNEHDRAVLGRVKFMIAGHSVFNFTVLFIYVRLRNREWKPLRGRKNKAHLLYRLARCIAPLAAVSISFAT